MKSISRINPIAGLLLAGLLYGISGQLRAQGSGLTLDYIHYTPKETGISDGNGMSLNCDWRLHSFGESDGALALQTRLDMDWGYDSANQLRNVALLGGVKWWLPNSGKFMPYVSAGMGWYNLGEPTVTTTVTGGGTGATSTGQRFSWTTYKLTNDYASLSSGTFGYAQAGVALKFSSEWGLHVGVTYEFNKGPKNVLDGTTFSAGLAFKY